MRIFSLIIIALLFIANLHAQEQQKKIAINFAKKAPVIDGHNDDDVWQNATIASDFIMYRPGFGNPEPKDKKTVVKMLYDNEALYISATLLDDKTSAIPMQFTTRDNFGQSDVFTVAINPYNDGINEFKFHVMSSGTQADERVSSDDGDFSWNAVWDSAVRVDDKAWYVEMKIPYSALRFPHKASENWGINFYRNIKSTNEDYSWNFIDKTKGNQSNYSGLLSGIKNITPPLRLSLYPYTQGSMSNTDGETKWKGTAGLDLKYGINESFTVDVTLIPDFGQTKFDNRVINLGPFEEQYEEKRAFFTEGTELFSKGDLFYSRRIGQRPEAYDEVYDALNEGESVLDNPKKAKLYNAFKVSGRLQNGLALGLFNAATSAKATLLEKDAITKRTMITSPLTNYNVMVLDQTFNNNSSISFVNTNVSRKGKSANANVSSVLLDYHTKDNNYSFNADLSMSNKFKTDDAGTGFKTELNFKKTHDANRYSASIALSDTNYDKNDMGIQDYNNFVKYALSYSYRTFKPLGVYNKIGFKAWSYLEYKYKPYNYADNGTGLAVWMLTKKQLRYGANINLYLGYLNDYYEPRVEGRFYKKKQLQYINFWLRTDYAKKMAVHTVLTAGSQFSIQNPQRELDFLIRPRYRFNNRFQMIYSFNLVQSKNFIGFVDFIEDSEDPNKFIIFGRRDDKEIINSLQGTYHLSTKSALSLTLRHNWTQIDFKNQYFLLSTNGLLNNTYNYNYNPNENVNYWNLDFNYTWEFAPGSQLIAQYRNIIDSENNLSKSHFINNVRDMFGDPDTKTNQLSLKLIYYLDYNKLKY